MGIARNASGHKLVMLTEAEVEQVFAEWWRRWKLHPEDYIDLEDAEDAEEYARGASSDFLELVDATCAMPATGT